MRACVLVCVGAWGWQTENLCGVCWSVDHTEDMVLSFQGALSSALLGKYFCLLGYRDYPKTFFETTWLVCLSAFSVVLGIETRRA